MKTQIKYYGVDNYGKKYNQTYSDVNPSANNETLLEFTSQIHSLSADSYLQTEKIVTTNLDTDIDTRTIPTLTANSTVINMASTTETTVNLTYNGDGMIYAYRKSGCDYLIFGDNGNNKLMIRKSSSSYATGGTIIVTATETTNYQAPNNLELTIAI